MTSAVIFGFLVIFLIRKVNLAPWWNEIKTISTANFSLLLTITRNTPKDAILKFDALSIHMYKCMCLWNSQHASNGTLRDFTTKYFGYPLGLLKPIRIEYSKKNTQFSHKLLCKQYLYVWCDYCVAFTSSYKYRFLIHIYGYTRVILYLRYLRSFCIVLYYSKYACK